MFNKKYTVWTATPVVETTDSSFDVSTLSASQREIKMTTEQDNKEAIIRIEVDLNI